MRDTRNGTKHHDANQNRRASGEGGHGSVHVRHPRPTLDFFDRLRRQTALLAVADAFAVGSGSVLDPVIEHRFREYTAASDHVLTVTGEGRDGTLGWLRPIGSLVLLVPQGCPDEDVVDAVAAALAAMNAVTLALEPVQQERFAGLCDQLSRFLPDAFARIDVGPASHYPPGATIAALLPGLLLFIDAPPVDLPPLEDSLESLVTRLFAFSRLSQLDVPLRS
ncbi:hypothetical protein HQQ80_14710 [Microbacteriaceae bacterium VKM Ac-2855]|nr:hypothetical protein [Microbacteriaceae bacterium VKM Ac-2855]